MSDGNFNRNLLPYHNYQSGIRAGRATTKRKAIELLEKLLSEKATVLSEEDRAELLNEFRQGL